MKKSYGSESGKIESDVNSLLCLQFRYKSRVYKHTNVNEMLIAKINIQVSILILYPRMSIFI